MTEFTPIMIGATLLLAGGAVGVMSVLSPKARAVFVYAQLVLMAGIYVGFAIASLDAADIIRRSDWSALLLESIVALGFVFAGLAALQSSRPWLLGVLILAHGVVDLAHLVFGGALSPNWYAFVCILYDGIVGLAAIWLLSLRSAQN